MKTNILAIVALLALLFTLVLPAPALAEPTREDRAVLDLLQEDLDALARANPIGASIRGDRRFDHLLPDVSPQAIAARTEANRDRLRRLSAIDRDRLSPDNLLNAELLELHLKMRIEGARFHPEQTPISQQIGPHITLPTLPDRLTFTTEKHLEDYLARLAAVPDYIDQVIENMRAGLEAGRTPPRVVMRGVESQIASLLKFEYVQRPATHPLYRPLFALPADDPRVVKARDTIVEEIIPALVRLRTFIREEYVPGCRETIGASEGPDGMPFYNHRIADFTTTDMTAEEVHELGRSEVARIRAEMFEVIARSDFPQKDELEGDDLFDAFVHYLRTDSRFYHETAEDLLVGYRDICKRMDTELPQLFRKLPRLPYGVEEMPAFMAPAAPTAYYYSGSLENGVAGLFIANTYRLDQRPKYEMVPLALHEAVPGHHLQIALAQELKDAGLHEWRTIADYTVFVEGWALYAERLGLEVGGPPGGRGFYEDPYDDFGRLSYEMWRALRLVVDTGMHAMGWSRQQAIDYMLANSALTESNIISEVDRYISWPGQALAYKIGELKIRELRAMAEEELGDRFDIRAFHDTVLEQGALPLGVLERRVRDWVREAK
ncbi:MAG: DUF885 domain-containing protein [Phycisphaeraceae bacterium]|nr:MAG: DUF885 domain-containing protein [Phycisphaeraceae bacterium]